MGRDAAVARALVSTGAAVVVLGSFRPWIASGAAERTSFEMVALVQRLGFSDSGLVVLAVRGWPLVPLCVAVAVAAVWWGRWRVGLSAATVGGLYAAGVAAAVRRSRDVGVVRVLAGSTVTLVGALVLLAGAASVVAVVVRERRVALTPPTRPGPAAPASAPPAGPS